MSRKGGERLRAAGSTRASKAMISLGISAQGAAAPAFSQAVADWPAPLRTGLRKGMTGAV
ncbi:MAG TPA: hypothetical protein P5137_08000 [Candidatus Brocadiia bacterium]|nr:hypothetical protein [Candidatus Brocadiia bacterium]